jgi:hypothetical protein
MKVALLKDPEVRKRFEHPPGENPPPAEVAAPPADGAADTNTAATT